MPEKVLKCPLCASNTSLPFDRCEFHGCKVENRICRYCGLVYQSPRMTDAESIAFYVEEYRLLQEGSSKPTARNIAAQRSRVDSLLKLTRNHVQSVSRHLDIGCSLGILLKGFKEAYHNLSYGIEPGEVHRMHAREEGLAVFASLTELEEQVAGQFDLISMSHVLEHLPDPVGYLNHLREKLLDSVGWLLIEVPNLYAHDSFEPAHLVAFSSHTVRQTLQKAGFDIVRLKSHGQPRSKFLPLYITVLARPRTGLPTTSHIIPEKRVTQKRRLGMLRRHLIERLSPQWAWKA